MYRGLRKSSFIPEPWGHNSRVLWEVHCGVWRRAWRSSWASSLTLRRLRRHPASPSRRRGRRCRVYSSSDVAWWHSVGPAGQGLACTSGSGARGDPGPPGRSAGVRTKEVRGSRGGPGPLEEGGPGPRLLMMGTPLRGGAWRHRTPPRAGGGSGAIRVMRWSPNGQSWQKSNGNSAEPVSSRVAGFTVLPQRPGWRSSDRSWRTGLRSQPLWGMVI